MPTYQDVVAANGAREAWALVEASGLSFAPYIGAGALVGAGVDAYQQAGPITPGFSLHVTNGKLYIADTLFSGSYWCQEAWVNPSSSSSGSNRLLLCLGANLVSAGSALYLPTGSNVLQFLGGGVSTSIGVTIPTGSWSLIQWGRFTDTFSEVTVAVNGQLVFNTLTSGFTGIGGIGFGGDTVQASTFAGSFAFPAIYNSSQSFLNWQSRYVALTDPTRAMQLSQQAPANNSALLDLIYAAVHRVFP